jgi:hypothetical protein
LVDTKKEGLKIKDPSKKKAPLGQRGLAVSPPTSPTPQGLKISEK